MSWFKKSRRAFISSVLGNIGVLLLSAGALSEPFIAFSAWMKASIFAVGVIVVVLAVIICPNTDDDASANKKEVR